MNQTSAVQLIKETFSEWSEDKVPRLAAALAYYTAFALAPLLLIAIAVAGFFFGREAATNQIGQQLAGLLGPTAADAVNTMVEAASANQGGGIIASIIGVATLLWVYYSAQILFFGAEFTQVYAKAYGSQIEPAENAIPVTEEARAQQGIPRREQVKQTAQLQERQVGGSDIASNPRTDQVEGTTEAGQSPNTKPASAGALAGFLVGLVLGRRQRAKE